jgi:hypothetical protein
MVRRTPEAIFVAHTMDPTRRTLYVEGKRDRSFIGWYAEASLEALSNVVSIDFVEIPNTLGGNRGRLMAFARMAQQAPNGALAFFADADFARLLPEDTPTNAWLTDFRDLEGYGLGAKSFFTLCALGLNSRVDATFFRAQILGVTRTAGILRLFSETRRLSLPFSELSVDRYLSVEGDFSITYDHSVHIRALLQRADRMSNCQSIAADFDTFLNEATIGAVEVSHGKDVLATLGAVFGKVKLSSAAETTFWTSVCRDEISGCSSLNKALAFVRAASVAMVEGPDVPA